jgi:hypothetical protein
MKNTMRQVAVIVSTLITITVNGLANGLPLNGLNTGEISDRFEIYFVPAGYVFSIWGLIYLGLLAYTIYQALPAQRDNPRLVRIGWAVVVGNFANAAWIFFWHYLLFPLSLLVMVILLAALLFIYTRLEIGKTNVDTLERWLVNIPFSVYLGWITVATIANTADVLDFVKWGQFGISDEIWMVVILSVVTMIAWLMSLTRKDVAYLSVLLWALAGIGVKFPKNGIVTTSVWVVFGLIGIAWLWALNQQIKNRSQG